ncbi:hypothetical protein ACJX0J_030329, partial [Zea mays]
MAYETFLISLDDYKYMDFITRAMSKAQGSNDHQHEHEDPEGEFFTSGSRLRMQRLDRDKTHDKFFFVQFSGSTLPNNFFLKKISAGEVNAIFIVPIIQVIARFTGIDNIDKYRYILSIAWIHSINSIDKYRNIIFILRLTYVLTKLLFWEEDRVRYSHEKKKMFLIIISTRHHSRASFVGDEDEILNRTIDQINIPNYIGMLILPVWDR